MWVTIIATADQLKSQFLRIIEVDFSRMFDSWCGISHFLDFLAEKVTSIDRHPDVFHKLNLWRLSFYHGENSSKNADLFRG